MIDVSEDCSQETSQETVLSETQEDETEMQEDHTEMQMPEEGMSEEQVSEENDEPEFTFSCEHIKIMSAADEIQKYRKRVLSSLLVDAHHEERAKHWDAEAQRNIMWNTYLKTFCVIAIAFMPMLYRVWTKVRRIHISRWEKHHAGPWDAAIRGSSALRAAISS